MNTSDKPQGIDGLPVLELSAVSLLYANTPKHNPADVLIKNEKPLPPDSPEVAAGVQELNALFPTLEAEGLHYEQEGKEAFNRRMAATKDEKGSPKNFLQAHMIIIDELLMNPGISVSQLAVNTGYSRTWLHKVMSSDAFQAKLAERQKALCDPIILNAIKDRLQGVVSRSLEIIEERLDNDKVSLDTALNAFSVGSKAMGLGTQKVAAPVNQFVVHMPAPVANAADWAAAHGGESAVGATAAGSPEVSTATEVVFTEMEVGSELEGVQRGATDEG